MINPPKLEKLKDTSVDHDCLEFGIKQICDSVICTGVKCRFCPLSNLDSIIDIANNALSNYHE